MKLEEIEKRYAKGYNLYEERGIIELFNDMEWLIDQAKKLEWLKQAVSVCNEENLTPKELAELLQNTIVKFK